MLKRIIKTTEEGSKTLHIPEWNENYHSQHGTLQEALHVFIHNGLDLIPKKGINILEMGFGTGFNAFVTLLESIQKQIKINYFSLEKYPVLAEEIEQLEYWNLIEFGKYKELYLSLHQSEWEKEIKISENFYLTKYQSDFFTLDKLSLPPIDLVYYDAFGARVQPDLWEEKIFNLIINTMNTEALLTTYSSKGSARRAMQAAGFIVEKKAGPAGKREMVNAWKKI